MKHYIRNLALTIGVVSVAAAGALPRVADAALIGTVLDRLDGLPKVVRHYVTTVLRRSRALVGPELAHRIDAGTHFAPLAGEQVGPYTLERELGRGGMGEVYLAFDDRLRRHVAIKQLRQDKNAPDLRERFRREAQAVAMLSHSSIVQVFDIVEADGTAWCMQCSSAVVITQRGDPCPRCQSFQLQVTGGDRMRVMDIEIE